MLFGYEGCKGLVLISQLDSLSCVYGKYIFKVH